MMVYSKKIEQALAAFKKGKSGARAFLFHQGQAFYLYDHEFCTIDYVTVSLSCQQMLIECQLYTNMIDSLFIKVEKGKITITTDTSTAIYDSENQGTEPFKLAISYGILHDEQGECYLRGFVYANSVRNPKIYSFYFTEPDIAALLELLVFQKVSFAPPALCEKNQAIEKLAEKINQENVKALSKVYLKGKNIATFD